MTGFVIGVLLGVWLLVLLRIIWTRAYDQGYVTGRSEPAKYAFDPIERDYAGITSLNFVMDDEWVLWL